MIFLYIYATRIAQHSTATHQVEISGDYIGVGILDFGYKNRG